MIADDELHLEFIYDRKNADRRVSRWSIEVAPFESKTKELFEWKASLKEGDFVDAHDKASWNKSTIFKIDEEVAGPDRSFPIAWVGFRIYQEGGSKKDEHG